MLTVTERAWFSRLLRHPARKQHILEQTYCRTLNLDALNFGI